MHKIMDYQSSSFGFFILFYENLERNLHAIDLYLCKQNKRI